MSVDTARFFADTLEFTFLGSDLVEAGWDIEHWYETRFGAGRPRSGHPFAAYIGMYADRLQRMKNEPGAP